MERIRTARTGAQVRQVRAASGSAEPWLVLLVLPWIEETEMGGWCVSNKMRLKDAGVREQEWAQKVLADGLLPKDVTFPDLLDHATYDASRDEILMTVKAVTYRFRVNRP